MLKDYASLRSENENMEKYNHYLQEKINDLNSYRKEKNVKNNAHMTPEESIKVLRNSLHTMSKMNKVLHKEIHKTKMDLNHDMSWTRSSEIFLVCLKCAIKETM